MKNRRLYTIVLPLFILIAVLAGLFFCWTDKCYKETVQPDFSIIKKTADIMGRHYHAQLDSLLAVNAGLQEKEKLIQKQLSAAKESNRYLQKDVNGLVARARAVIDTPAKLVICDSLQDAVEELAIVSGYKDSLYEGEIGTLNDIIGNKDSIINVRQQMYVLMSQSFDICTANTHLLLEENARYTRQLKRHRTKKRLLTTITGVVSALAIYSFTKH